MKLERREIDGAVVIELVESTEIELGNGNEFKSCFEELLTDQGQWVVFDTSQVDEVFRMAVFDVLFRLYPDVNGAVRSFEGA